MTNEKNDYGTTSAVRSKLTKSVSTENNPTTLPPLPIPADAATQSPVNNPDIESQISAGHSEAEEQPAVNNNPAWRERAGMAAKIGGMILAASGAAAEHTGASPAISKSLKGAGILFLAVSLGLENPFQNEESRTKANLTAKGLRTGAVILGIASTAASDKTTGIFAILSQAGASTIEFTPKAINAARNILNKRHQDGQTEEQGSHVGNELARRQSNNDIEQGRS
ncbi:MAG: hypothetical protein PQ612_09900 [Rickettsiales bacterium]|nr:hypothetical protein [Pseudomonadota bacterium]MDA0967151.1 hypothetical protein [Pseudomonadota bacterium]MDG4544336.1 hypothetical protein [Rickettsiales bacterium]MDG4546466.1 hypothetical protein [Rickettsiales bacterium]MDG4548612.1 hypothetical protein [Rickettsiales bacterium]